MVQMEVLLEKCLVKDYGKQIAVVLFFCKKLNKGRMIFISMTENATHEKKLLSVDEVCSYLGLGATKVREMLNSPASTFTVRVGRRVMANKTMLIDKAAKFQLKI